MSNETPSSARMPPNRTVTSRTLSIRTGLSARGAGLPLERAEYMRRVAFREAHRLLLDARLFVEREHLLGKLRQILDAVFVRRVGREELRRRAAARELRHLLPERDRGPRIVAGARGQLDAHAIGFGLVDARVRQHVGDLPDHARETGADLPGAREEDIGHGSRQARADAGGDLLRSALTAMLAQRVRDLVSHDGGELVVGDLDLFDDAGVDRDLAAWHAPGVDLWRGQDVHLPFPVDRVLAKDRGLRDE